MKLVLGADSGKGERFITDGFKRCKIAVDSILMRSGTTAEVLITNDLQIVDVTKLAKRYVIVDKISCIGDRLCLHIHI